MEKTIFVHIGSPKTGTTALQEFLHRNRVALAAKGFCYPDCDRNHRDICPELRDHTAAEIKAKPGPVSLKLLRDIGETSCPRCIISAECLSFTVDPENLRALLPSESTIKIIYYARRQDDLIESWYTELVKQWYYRQKDPLDDSLIDFFCKSPEFDHFALVSRWAAVFGKEHVIVRCYEKNQMPGGILEDFAGITGLPLDAELEKPSGMTNPSMNIRQSEFVRLCNLHLEGIPAINEYLYTQHFKTSRAWEHLPMQYRLSPKARIGILNHFEESNRRVAREFLGREDGRLFRKPWPDPDAPWEPFRGLQAEDLVPIIAEMMYTAEKRREKQFERLQPLIACLEILNHFLKKGISVLPFRVKKALQDKTDQWYGRK